MSLAQPDRTTPTAWSGTTARDGILEVRDTILYVERRGRGRPLLLIHGAGEDAGMLRPQAESLAAAGFQVVSPDRRGTGHSGRDAWPGDGVRQHAGDAAALLRLFGLGPAVIVGVGTGGVVAVQLALEQRDLVAATLVWEAPAAGVVPACVTESIQLRNLTSDFLAQRPGDYCGAQAILLTKMYGSPVTLDDPAFARARVNAEPMVRDDLTIALAEFPARLDLGPLVLATSSSARPCTSRAMDELASRSGTSVSRLPCAAEPYRTEPSVLTALARSLATSLDAG